MVNILYDVWMIKVLDRSQFILTFFRPIFIFQPEDLHRIVFAVFLDSVNIRVSAEAKPLADLLVHLFFAFHNYFYFNFNLI